jgi:hypothetical protein
MSLLSRAPHARNLRLVGVAAALSEPLFLMHGRSLAEAAIVVVGACFLGRCVLAGSWGWIREGWVPIGLAWWGWLVVCSAPGIGGGGWESFGQALAAGRLPLFVAALEHDLLREPAARRWMARIVTFCAAYIAAQVALQFATGRNLYGYPRSGDGELTGPFPGPRAGPPMARILFPAILPAAAALLEARRLSRTVAAYALLLGGMAALVLIGQRMPVLLGALGLLVAALLLPRLRTVAAAALVGGAALIAASAVVSPPSYHRLVDKFEAQMGRFPSSEYGVIYTRAGAIAAENPVTGLGMNGFRNGCPQARYDVATLDGRKPDGGGAGICTTHPHNFYAQAASDSGFPGLILFSVLALAWMAPLLRAARTGAPMAVALFAAALVQLWPIASTSGFYTLPMAGWLFLILGWGLAEARATLSPASPRDG